MAVFRRESKNIHILQDFCCSVVEKSLENYSKITTHHHQMEVTEVDRLELAGPTETNNSLTLLQNAMLETYNNKSLNHSQKIQDADYLEFLETSCQPMPKPLLTVQMISVGIFGTAISAISIIENLFLIYMFMTRPRFRRSHLYYMNWLAFNDIIICVSYILLMVIYDVYVPFFENINLYLIASFYVRPLFAITHVSLTASSFLMVAAALEKCSG